MALGSPRAERHGEADGGRMTLVEHLAELRSRLIRAMVALAVGACVGFLLYQPVLDVLVDPYCDVKADQVDGAEDLQPGDQGCDLVVTDPLESFSIRLKLSGYIGLLLASPVVLWQVWRFVTPGLYAREKRFAIPFVASAVFLFALGAVTAWLADAALHPREVPQPAHDHDAGLRAGLPLPDPARVPPAGRRALVAAARVLAAPRHRPHLPRGRHHHAVG
jgi:hypothetical protein